MALAIQTGFISFRSKTVLHFAPEPIITSIVMREKPAGYRTADICPGRADLVLDLENIDLEDESVDLVIASHVLEHVNDRKAIPELYRILRPGGELVAMVPLIEGWAETFEDEAKTSPEERQLYFGLPSHVRYYGADFRSRLAAPGFRVSEFTAGPIDSVDFRLARGMKVFLAVR